MPQPPGRGCLTKSLPLGLTRQMLDNCPVGDRHAWNWLSHKYGAKMVNICLVIYTPVFWYANVLLQLPSLPLFTPQGLHFCDIFPRSKFVQIYFFCPVIPTCTLIKFQIEYYFSSSTLTTPCSESQNELFLEFIQGSFSGIRSIK